MFKLKSLMGEFGNTLLPNALNRFAELLSEMQQLNKEIVRPP